MKFVVFHSSVLIFPPWFSCPQTPGEGGGGKVFGQGEDFMDEIGTLPARLLARLVNFRL